MKYELRVQRQGVDPTAESSRHAMRDIMGAPVLAVEHGELWQFVVEGSASKRQVRDAIENAASRAGRYVNLNRDVMLWEEDESTQSSPDHGCHVDVWVRQAQGDDARALQWFRRHTGLVIEQMRRGRWYRVHVDIKDPLEAQRCVEALATSHSRSSGLLANPHSEKVDILRVGTNGVSPRGITHAR